jgi:hypothetical protein
LHYAPPPFTVLYSCWTGRLVCWTPVSLFVGRCRLRYGCYFTRTVRILPRLLFFLAVPVLHTFTTLSPWLCLPLRIWVHYLPIEHHLPYPAHLRHGRVYHAGFTTVPGRVACARFLRVVFFAHIRTLTGHFTPAAIILPAGPPLLPLPVRCGLRPSYTAFCFTCYAHALLYSTCCRAVHIPCLPRPALHCGALSCGAAVLHLPPFLGRYAGLLFIRFDGWFCSAVAFFLRTPAHYVAIYRRRCDPFPAPSPAPDHLGSYPGFFTCLVLGCGLDSTTCLSWRDCDI